MSNLYGQALEASREQLHRLEHELHSHYQSLDPSLDLTQVKRLERKIIDLEDRLSYHDEEWHMNVDQINRLHEMDLMSIHKKTEHALNMKNLEIEQFRGEMLFLLQAAKDVQNSEKPVC